MTIEKFQEVKDKIIDFCEKHNINYEISSEWKEVDFIFDYGEEAIDCHSLENPTCICTEQYIVVDLPTYVNSLTYDERCEYYDIVLGLGGIAHPDYIIGAKDGLCKKVMYCVWGA